MSNEVATRDMFSDPEDGPSGASDRRGTARFTEVAKVLIQKYPVGEILSATLMDQWLHDQELLIVPPEGTPKNSDQWLGHLQRRHIVIGRINRSSTHPRMRDQGSVCFVIVARGGKFLIKAPQEVILEGELPKKLQSVCVTGRKHLRFLMESADWPSLAAHEKAIAEAIDDDFDLFEEHIASSTKMLAKKLGKLQTKIKRALMAGEIVSTDGGINKFLSAPPEENGTQA